MAELMLCALMAFSVGEKLTYKVKYGPLTAATLTLEVMGTDKVGGESCYHLVSHLVSNPTYSHLFFFDDIMESWCRTSDFVTLRVHKDSRGAKSHTDVTTDFDYATNTASYSDSTQCHIHPDSRDMLSLWYYFRVVGMEMGDTLNLWSHWDKKNYSVSASADDQQHVSTPAGEFDCLVIDMNSSSPAAVGTVYLSNDEESLPVIIRTRLPLGYVTLSLTGRDANE